MNLWVILIVVSLLIATTTCTLSPPSNKQKKDKRNIDSKKGPVDQSVFDKGLVTKDTKSNDILKESGAYYKNTEERHFTNEILGYVTPWNAGGYEVTKTFHGKLTLVSPVWFSIPYGFSKKNQLATHDVQKKWLDEIKKENTDHHTLKVVPRILFESDWKPGDIASLHNNQERKNHLISVLAKAAEMYGFHGYVLEIRNEMIFIESRSSIEFLKSLAEGLKNKNLLTILAIPPTRSPDPSTHTFSQKHFNALAPFINYFSLMTYDFSNVQRPGPNSPIEWARSCVKQLVPDDNDPRRAQILMGLNFYGNKYTTDGGGAILAHEYLKLLESIKGKIQWDDKSKEHFFEYRTSAGSGFVFYPTLYSIQERIDLARELGTGLSIWELGQGLNYFYDLF